MDMPSIDLNDALPGPKGVPIPYNEDASFWRSTLADLDDLKSTPELSESSDIVIIGAGYAGVATAWHLLKGEGFVTDGPKPSITILEARGACSGATGRNGDCFRN